MDNNIRSGRYKEKYYEHSFIQNDGMGCILWSGKYSNNLPYVYINSKSVPVRRLAYEMHHGWINMLRYRIQPSCGNHKCVSPDHLKLSRVIAPRAFGRFK